MPCFRAARRLVVWLLVGLTQLQGMAAGVIATIGPAHVHLAAATSIVLEDVRRAPGRTVARPIHVATAFGHFHAADSPQRHHHAKGDASVVLVGGEPLPANGDADELSVSPALAAFFALLPGAVAWQPRAPRDVLAWCAAWAPRTHSPEPLERPPRSA